jgi:pyrophosphatase PpaX
MPRPLAILLDLDGTLVDTLELLLSASRHAFRDRAERVPTEAEWRAGIGTPLARQLAPYAADDAELAALVAGYRGYQHEHHDRLTRLYPGVREALGTLRDRGHPLGVVTSKSDAIAHRTLAHVGLAPWMAVVVGTESSARHKPDPEPVRVALAALGYAPHEALFVGDSPHDVQAGRAAGVVTVAAGWGFFDAATLADAAPDHTLDDVASLPALVERIARERTAGPAVHG